MIEPTSKDVSRGVIYNGQEAVLVGFDHNWLYLRFGRQQRGCTSAKRENVDWSTNPGEVLTAALSRLKAAGINAVMQSDRSFLVAEKFSLASNGAWREIDGERMGYAVDTLIKAVNGEPAPLTKAAAEAAAEH